MQHGLHEYSVQSSGHCTCLRDTDIYTEAQITDLMSLNMLPRTVQELGNAIVLYCHITSKKRWFISIIRIRPCNSIVLFKMYVTNAVAMMYNISTILLYVLNLQEVLS